jgi:hypothetical protein
MDIDTWSADPEHPYANLQPIVDALVAAGNSCLSDGFQPSPDAWECRMAGPIDMALVAAMFTLPPNVVASASTDTVLDRNTWSVIEGPGADKARSRASDIRRR